MRVICVFHLSSLLVAGADPESWDAQWDIPQANTVAQNQGTCGSCWAFSSTEQLSARIFKLNNTKLAEWGSVLSPQAPLAFGHAFNEHMAGCSGSNAYLAGKYFQAKGVPSLTCAPYTSGTCTSEEDQAKNGCTSYTEGSCWGSENTWTTFGLYTSGLIQEIRFVNGYEDMQHDLVAYGPLSASFDFFSEFGVYQGGVMKTATPDNGRHAILITGYANDVDGTPYWRIRNSWGATWGEDGYCRIIRGKNLAKIEEGATSYILSTGKLESNSSYLQGSRGKPLPPYPTPNSGAWVERNVTENVISEVLLAVRQNRNVSHVEVLSAWSQIVQGVNFHLNVIADSNTFAVLANKPPLLRNSDGLFSESLPQFRILKITPIPEVVIV